MVFNIILFLSIIFSDGKIYDISFLIVSIFSRLFEIFVLLSSIFDELDVISYILLETNELNDYCAETMLLIAVSLFSIFVESDIIEFSLFPSLSKLDEITNNIPPIFKEFSTSFLLDFNCQ